MIKLNTAGMSKLNTAGIGCTMHRGIIMDVHARNEWFQTKGMLQE